MENRFSFKDLLVLTLLAVLIVSVWLAVKAWDRQWEQLQAIRARVDDQGRDLRDIQKALASGVAVASPSSGTSTTAPTTQADDPFARLRAARRMPGFATGGLLVDAFGNSVGKLTPLVSSDAYAAVVQDYVLESLASRDPATLEWVPWLSTGWKIVDRVAEQDALIQKLKAAGKTDEEIAKDASVPPAIQIKFTMRPGVRFSDGTPLTADDVVFTYQWIMNPKINAPRERSSFERITSVEKTADDEVTFTFREPYFAAFEQAAGFGIMAAHFYGKYAPEAFNESVGLLLGSGPYRLENPTNWRPGTLIKLVPNDRYWGVGGAFDGMVWREISNDGARLAAFRNRDTDLFPASPEQYAKMIKEPTILDRTQQFEYQNPVGGYRYVAWNELKDGKPTLFADVRVRQAMTMLLDRQRLIDQVMLGYAVPATGPFNPLSKQCDPAIKPWPYDVAAATKLLKEAGFSDRDGDGVLESPSGEKFQFKLTYPSGSANYESMALFMKDAYAKAGIVLKPDPLDWSVMVERLNKKNFEAISLGWTAGIESDIYQMFDSSQAITEGDNFMSYKSSALDGAVRQARRTVDEDKRMALWRQAHRQLHEDQPYTFLFFAKSLIFVDKRIENIQRVKLGLNPRIEWFVPKASQRTAN